MQNNNKQNNNNKIKDCSTCYYGRYNDHWKLSLCYCDKKCNSWDKWEDKNAK